MKKIFTLVFTLVFLYSCNDSQQGTGTTTAVAGNLVVNVLQTQGTAAAHNELVSQDLNQIVPNFSSINTMTVNSLSFQYGNVTGNDQAIIESGTITVNGIEIADVSNVNMANEASNQRVFSVTQQSILNQVAAKFLEEGFIALEFVGSILSDEGSVNFTIVVSLNLTAEIL